MKRAIKRGKSGPNRPDLTGVEGRFWGCPPLRVLCGELVATGSPLDRAVFSSIKKF